MKKNIYPSIITAYFIIIIFGAACTQSPTISIRTATPILSSTPSITPFLSPTPTSTYISITPVFSGTQAPNSKTVISEENADRLTLFARWGNGNVSDAQYTPDGEYLVTAYSSGIYFYSAKDYSFVKYIDLGTAISNITITKDGQKMAASSLNSVFIFNRGENKPTLTINETASALAFSPDGQILAVGTYSWPAGSGFIPKGIKLFDSITGKMVLEFKDSELARTLTFSPDGTRLAAGGYATQIWSLDGKLLDTHGPYVSGGVTDTLSFSPDGTLLAEGAATDNILHVWRVLANGKLVIFRAISLGNHSMVPIVLQVVISYDGKRLAAATSSGLLVWELSSGALIYHKNDTEGNSVRYDGVTWSPDGDNLSALSEKRGIEIWNMKNGELLNTFNKLTGPITALAWQPKGEMIVSGTDIDTVFLLDPQNGNISNVFAGDFSENRFAFSPDGSWLAIKSNPFSNDDGVVIYKLTDSSYHYLLAGSYGDGLSNQSFSRNGKYLVTSGFDDGKRIVQIWDTQSWNLYKAWKVNDDLVSELIFCPDGETVASVESRKSAIKFYRITDGVLILSIELSATVGTARVNAIAFSPDGHKLLTRSRECETSNDCRQVLRIWQTGTKNLLYMIKDLQQRRTLPPSPPYYSDISSSIAWSPGGDLFAVGFSDGIIEIFRASDGKLLQTLNGHTLMVMGVTFSPNGQILASASLDGTIRLWGIK